MSVMLDNPVLTHGPTDLAELDRWFLLSGDAVHVFRLGSEAVAGMKAAGMGRDQIRRAYTHWSLLTDDERGRVWDAIT
jgi:hypothetical protein